MRYDRGAIFDMKKKLLAIVLCAALIISSTQAVYADRKSELKNSVAAEENKLKETQSQIESNSQANDAIKAQTTTHQRNGSIFEKSNSSKNGKNESIPTIIK